MTDQPFEEYGLIIPMPYETGGVRVRLEERQVTLPYLAIRGSRASVVAYLAELSRLIDAAEQKIERL